MIFGVHHFGMGVNSVEKSLALYRDILGFNKLVWEDRGESNYFEMHGKSVKRRVVMFKNDANDEEVEFLEFYENDSQHTPQPLSEDYQWGSIGLMEVGFEVPDIDQMYARLSQEGYNVICKTQDLTIASGIAGRSFYLKDSDGFLVQLFQRSANLGKKDSPIRLNHVGIGVIDMGQSLELYRDLLGLTNVIYDVEGSFPLVDKVVGKPVVVRIALLSNPKAGAKIKLVKMLPPNELEDPTIGRNWGDMGCMEVALSTDNILDTYKYLAGKGIQFEFPVGDINHLDGTKTRIVYFRDPNGVEVEFIERAS